MTLESIVIFVCTLGFVVLGPTWAGKAFAKGVKAYKKEMHRE